MQMAQNNEEERNLESIHTTYIYVCVCVCMRVCMHVCMRKEGGEKREFGRENKRNSFI